MSKNTIRSVGQTSLEHRTPGLAVNMISVEWIALLCANLTRRIALAAARLTCQIRLPQPYDQFSSAEPMRG